MRLLKHPAKIPDYRAVIHLTKREGPLYVLGCCQARQRAQVNRFKAVRQTFPSMHLELWLDNSKLITGHVTALQYTHEHCIMA